MAIQNTSDMIEAYLKQLLATTPAIEIKRSELAQYFEVVPSQINYVIKTRFTLVQGYEVESKRGGGGYIKIGKIQFSADHYFLQALCQQLPNQLNQKEVLEVLQLLTNEGFVNGREQQLLAAVVVTEGLEDAQRAQMLKALIQRLDREEHV